MRVLIVEDDTKLTALLQRGLSRDGMAVDVAANGEDAVPRALATEYDAIVLDVMLPGIDGFEVCRKLREAEVWAPVLMLTARDGVRDRVAGLDAAPTTTSPSPSPMPNCWRGCAPCSAAARASARPS